ncbi:TetR/AcrR family transcriptional regulator C-terminal domain-containing protein [Nocardia sp. NEAU-G5]|uniref:TetR/AcrR family transcriptional regulator C-terminal domain-containing protein n=1 Tax=Nocardia albiluteola TaxID=2842303 RepID=A0ABS6B9G3_9NOCA|nr:TetR/AcrR family transcriptional regulator C-terminal domain-containing protein [Nocardia albiluteola]MBU3065863.1 TetR/AcrR family transcriptional regulator C-terminal domain-containing protein [Nocardia albiluteola]
MTSARRGRPRTGSGLTRPAVVTAAREIVREEGVDRLSMRRVASRLGVDVSSLYWHVGNKDELIDLLADDLLADAVWPDPALPWRHRVEQALTSYRDLLLTHRDAATIVAGRWVQGPNTLRALETLVAALLTAGLTPPAAAETAFLLNSYVTGFVLQELRPMNAAEAAGSTAAQVLDQARTRLEELPEADFPALRLVAAHLTAPNMDDRFRRGIALTLDGLHL